MSIKTLTYITVFLTFSLKNYKKVTNRLIYISSMLFSSLDQSSNLLSLLEDEQDLDNFLWEGGIGTD